MNRRRRVFACLTVAAAVLLATAARQDDGRLGDAAFAALVQSASEKDGRFPFAENFSSNEKSYQAVIPELQNRVAWGGVYVGVGPEQNFTFINAVRPALAFIVDIRRQNLLEHLMYKIAIEKSPTRADLVSYLFSRPRPPGLDTDTDVTNLFRAYLNVPRALSLLTEHQNEVVAVLRARFPGMLSGGDEGTIKYLMQTFSEVGPLITYQGRVAAPTVGAMARGERSWPTLAAMMTAVDGEGRQRSYLASESGYLVVKQLEERNLVVPVVGDFGGPKAIRAIGEYVRGRHMVVTTFYCSNVEQYLFDNGPWKEFYANVATLPLDATSTFIRDFAPPRFSSAGTNFEKEMLSPMQEFLAAFAAGKIRNYQDVEKLSK